MAVFAKSLSSYYRQCATATINFVAGEYCARIATEDGWYIEPPSSSFLPELIRQIRLWAGNDYDVAVIEDFDNAGLSPRGMQRASKAKNPRQTVREMQRRDDAEARARRVKGVQNG